MSLFRKLYRPVGWGPKVRIRGEPPVGAAPRFIAGRRDWRARHWRPPRQPGRWRGGGQAPSGS
jgi:hypothetical protein